ncbi:type II toxin-antitoxin system HicA family toxin [Marinicrinis sediminis]|uniref:Type II toxin-antitoxin system HicA family toxin n=1 Tax=Marinicrinis sediminis TaxID=1652465 RepID=A0ABW5R715_9BACL
MSLHLEHNGYMPDRTKGSHHSLGNAQGEVITIPRQHPVKAVYVKDVLERIGDSCEFLHPYSVVSYKVSKFDQ